jgi:hypothetical protein
MNYRDEMEHDRLDAQQLLADAFQMAVPAGLERAQRRKAFDVELTFSNLSCVIETKVDSNESGGWGHHTRLNGYTGMPGHSIILALDQIRQV